MLPELAEAYVEEGEFEAAAAVLAEASEAARTMGDERLQARAKVGGLRVEYQSSGFAAGSRNVVSELEQIVEVFERARDIGGLARAWQTLYLIYGTWGRYDRVAEAAKLVVDYASRDDDARLAARGAIAYSVSALRGPTPVTEALQRCEELLIAVGGDRKAEAVILGVLAQLHAMKGEFEEGRALYAKSHAMLMDLGPSVLAASTSTESSRVEMLAGDARAAERELRRDYDALSAMGERYSRTTIACLLAQSLWALGRFDEADAFARIAQDESDPDDVSNQVIWRSVRAKLLARDGRVVEAVALAKEAVTLIETTVDITTVADTLVDMADVLDLAGRRHASRPPLEEALRLYQAKGDEISARSISDRLAKDRLGASG
jgi:tetratricopeptide (TPR) repeat protein